MSDAPTRAREFVQLCVSRLRTVVLGTAGSDGEPAASVAATVLDASGAFIIYVSGLAMHTRHLLANPRASVLLVDDETDSPNPLARRRLTFACAVQVIPIGTDQHDAQRQALREKFGPTIDVVAALPDFKLLRLEPRQGRAVIGFGAAFEIDPRNWHRAETLRLAPVRPSA